MSELLGNRDIFTDKYTTKKGNTKLFHKPSQFGTKEFHLHSVHTAWPPRSFKFDGEELRPTCFLLHFSRFHKETQKQVPKRIRKALRLAGTNSIIFHKYFYLYPELVEHFFTNQLLVFEFLTQLENEIGFIIGGARSVINIANQKRIDVAHKLKMEVRISREEIKRELNEDNSRTQRMQAAFNIVYASYNPKDRPIPQNLTLRPTLSRTPSEWNPIEFTPKPVIKTCQKRKILKAFCELNKVQKILLVNDVRRLTSQQKSFALTQNFKRIFLPITPEAASNARKLYKLYSKVPVKGNYRPNRFSTVIYNTPPLLSTPSLKLTIYQPILSIDFLHSKLHPAKTLNGFIAGLFTEQPNYVGLDLIKPSFIRDLEEFPKAISPRGSPGTLTPARLVADIRRMEENLYGRHVRVISTLRQAKDYHDALVDEINAERDALAAEPFKIEPPLPGTETIIPLKSPLELLKEGREMKHCVGGYASSVKQGRSYIYSIRFKEERATLSIEMSHFQPIRISQLLGPCNRPVSTELRKHVEEWFKQTLSGQLGAWVALQKSMNQ